MSISFTGLVWLIVGICVVYDFIKTRCLYRMYQIYKLHELEKNLEYTRSNKETIRKESIVITSYQVIFKTYLNSEYLPTTFEFDI